MPDAGMPARFLQSIQANPGLTDIHDTAGTHLPITLAATFVLSTSGLAGLSWEQDIWHSCRCLCL